MEWPEPFWVQPQQASLREFTGLVVGVHAVTGGSADKRLPLLVTTRNGCRASSNGTGSTLHPHLRCYGELRVDVQPTMANTIPDIRVREFAAIPSAHQDRTGRP